MEVPLALPCLAMAALCSDLCPIPGGELGELGREEEEGQTQKGKTWIESLVKIQFDGS